ncbi:hypothetical protein KP509_30G070900 [Ceratopteris richardii]|uniref:EF-hand domain-containing protein n=1 Tax=Ceratopteris richardii TaxID=49495 RepID=A0A8T2R5X1_CERRI|nr:hypothetical protein KP509_30G070900 [Ceratopteris richardii]
MELGLEFKDCLPVMAEKLGERGLMQELAKGFELLSDPLSHTITLHSLKRSTTLLGLVPMSDCELREMINVGDSSGRGELDLHDFCVAMVRASPELMDLALSVLFEDVSSEKESCTSR